MVVAQVALSMVVLSTALLFVRSLQAVRAIDTGMRVNELIITTPVALDEAGADNDSIYVDASGNQGGNVGFGTATPVVDLHVLSGNTPISAGILGSSIALSTSASPGV